MAREKPPRPKQQIVFELDLPTIRIPPQQVMEEVPTPSLVDQIFELERQIRATKEILAYIETQSYRQESHLTKDQVSQQISFYTKRFRELLLRRHAMRGEVVGMPSMG